MLSGLLIGSELLQAQLLFEAFDHLIVVAELACKGVCSVSFHKHIRWNGVDVKLLAEVLPLLLIQAVVYALDGRNGLYIGGDI